MDESTEKLTSAALRLSPADRAKLAEALFVSLEGEDPSWEAAWLVEAARRIRAARADSSRVRSAADTFAAVRQRFPAEEDPSR